MANDGFLSRAKRSKLALIEFWIDCLKNPETNEFHDSLHAGELADIDDLIPPIADC
jgi:hypothetical protein